MKQLHDYARNVCRLFRKLGDPWGIAFASGIAGEIARQQGDFQQAKEYFRNNLVFHWQHG